MIFSDKVSNEDVDSSNIYTSAFFNNSLAKHKRCFSPPDKLLLLFSIRVYILLGKLSIKSLAYTASNTCRILILLLFK